MLAFDEARLDDPVALAAADDLLRPLAEAGARLRRDITESRPAILGLGAEMPRAVIAVGPEARLLRAVLEPVCPVPFVAWSVGRLPGWVGPLDLVVVLGGEGSDLSGAHEALRRGARLLVVAPPDSLLAHGSASRSTTLLPVLTSDPFPAAIVALTALQRLGLGEETQPGAVADALDAVATASGHAASLATNPAKMLAIELADAQPLVWGASVLAARASRRIAEAVRTASGRVALAADASELLPILASVGRRDPFADPVDGDQEDRPTLVIVEDGHTGTDAVARREALVGYAEAADVRVSVIGARQGATLARYATVLATGRFAATYLKIGLGRARF